jgi:hypothetical protein
MTCDPTPMNRTFFILIGALLSGGLLCGCGTAKPEAMVPTSFTLDQKHTSSVSVSTPLGKEAKAKWTSQITSEAFLEAVAQSVQKSGLFAAVLKTPGADFDLQISCVNGDEPAFGFNMTVDLVTRWALTKKSSGEALFRENVSTTYTAKMGDAFAGATRLRLANEGVARENIKEGLRRLSKLKL